MVTMETGVELWDKWLLWGPWWWNLELMSCIMEGSPGSFYNNAPVVVQWTVTKET